MNEELIRMKNRITKLEIKEAERKEKIKKLNKKNLKFKKQAATIRYLLKN